MIGRLYVSLFLFISKKYYIYKNVIMESNYWILLAAALVPNIVGMIWYGFIFKSTWLQTVGKSEDELKEGNRAIAFIITYIVGLFLALGLMPIVIHQLGVFQMLNDVKELEDVNSDLSKTLANLLTSFGDNFRSFKHGMLHGALTALFFILPTIAMNAYYERRNWKYVAVNVGFMMVCMAIIGGIVCQWA